MYYNPILFDRSETIVEQFTINPTRKKYLIIFEQNEIKVIRAFIDEVQKKKIEHDLIVISGEVNQKEIQKILLQQKMGTQLYISSTWDKVAAIFSEAVEAGFTEDEIQTVIQGPKKKFLYCMKCFSLNEIQNEKEEECMHCEAMLEVGPFFSIVRKGYIGYPFIPL